MFHRLKLSVVIEGHDVSSSSTPHMLLMSPRAASFAYLSEERSVLEATHLNILGSTTGFRPLEWEKRRFDTAFPEISEVAEKVLDYCRRYLPFLAKAEVVGAVAGSVLSGIDTGKRSADALRNLNVIRAHGVDGYHSVTGMKLSNIPLAAFTALKAVMKVTAGAGHDWGMNLEASGEAFMTQLTRDPDFMLQPFHACSMERQHVTVGTMEGFAMRR